MLTMLSQEADCGIERSGTLDGRPSIIHCFPDCEPRAAAP